MTANTVLVTGAASGIGLACARMLLDDGCNIVGFDISTGMLEQAHQKGVYEELVEHDINDFEEFPPKYNNSFDFVVAAGIVNNNY